MAGGQSPSLIKRLFSRFLSKRDTSLEGATPARTFQAVSIFHGAYACPAARQLSELRYLAKDAPTLPLPDCTMPDSCECRYLKHKDRRSAQRRLVDFTTSQRIYRGQERRVLKGRRSSD